MTNNLSLSSCNPTNTIEEFLNLKVSLQYIRTLLKKQTNFTKWDGDVEIALASVVDSFIYDICSLVLRVKANDQNKNIQRQDIIKSLYLDASLHYFLIKPNILNNNILNFSNDLSLEDLSLSSSSSSSSSSMENENVNEQNQNKSENKTQDQEEIKKTIKNQNYLTNEKMKDEEEDEEEDDEDDEDFIPDEDEESDDEEADEDEDGGFEESETEKHDKKNKNVNLNGIK